MYRCCWQAGQNDDDDHRDFRALLLGWGNADEPDAGRLHEAEHLAIRMGFSPAFPFEAIWRIPLSDYSATHSILLGSWSKAAAFRAPARAAFHRLHWDLLEFHEAGRWGRSA